MFNNGILIYTEKAGKRKGRGRRWEGRDGVASGGGEEYNRKFIYFLLRT